MGEGTSWSSRFYRVFFFFSHTSDFHFSGVLQGSAPNFAYIIMCSEPQGTRKDILAQPWLKTWSFRGLFLALGIALYYLITRKQILNVLRGSLLAILAIPSSPRLAVWYFCLHQMKAATSLGLLTSTTTPCLIHCSMTKATYKRSHLIELGAC